MVPASSCSNAPYSGKSNSKLMCDYFSGHSKGNHFSNFNYLFFIHPRSVVRFPSWSGGVCSFERMQYVLGFSYIFKIIKAIILWVKINVVDFLFGRVWSNKSQHYQGVNPKLLGSFRPGQNYGHISARASWRHHSYFLAKIKPAFSLKALNTPPIRNLIPAFVARDWQPAFNCGRNIVSHLRTCFRGRLERLWDHNSHAARFLYPIFGIIST